MANTLGGLTLSQIAQMSLNALLPDLLMLNAFTTDFSNEIATVGGSVQTRFPSAMTAADLSAGPGAVLTDVTSTARTVTLNKQKGFAMAFTDLEASTIGIAQLQRLFIEPARNAVITAFTTDLLNLVTAANFSSGSVVTAAQLDADKMADLAQILSTAKVPKAGRFALLPPTYIANLAKDNAIQAQYAVGNTDAIRDGIVRRVHGFDIYEYTEIPTNGADNLAALVGNKQGLILAARQPATPQNWFGEVENVSDPDSGLPLQYRMFYDGLTKKTILTVESLYGVQIGVTGNIYRLASA